MKVNRTNITNFFILVPDSRNAKKRLRARIWRDFVVGVFLSAVLAGLWFLIGRTELGEEVRRLTYVHLQRRLTPPKEIPITLVDISELIPDSHGVTPRAPLKKLINALLVYSPKVIGLDIDFSPEILPGSQNWKFVSGDDPMFFQFCLSKNRPDSAGPRIYLGISRTQALPRDLWLGLPEY